jgi:hypothetical protein
MNWTTIGNLIGLRYKLMWAKTRTRNGKIALFVTGYLLLVLMLVILGAGGIGGGVLAVRSGKAGVVARAVLSGLYVQATLGTLMLGFGMNAIFSDTELRRYPLSARERRFTRHFIGIVDPFWALVFALEFGLLFGLLVFGAAFVWLGLPAILLLLVSNYLLARALGLLVDRLAQSQAGATVLMAAVILISTTPGLAAQSLQHNPRMFDTLLAILRFTPPFGAADAMTKFGADGFYGLLIVIGWVLLFSLALWALEQRPTERRTAETTAIHWDSRYDRFGALFGARNAPLVAYWLRFYTRNTRFRTMYMLTLPLAAFLTFNFARSGGAKAGGYFVAALGTFPILTYLGTARFAVNQFGYSGGAFRRYFLLPVAAGDCLRTGSYASLLLGAAMLPVGLIAWAALVPEPYDARSLAMLLASGLTGLFIFHGLGLWSSLFGARRGNYTSAIGNDLSLFGNIVLLGCVLTGLFLPQLLHNRAPDLPTPANWWVMALVALAALVFYIFSLRAASAVLFSRREQLMALVEGRA